MLGRLSGEAVKAISPKRTDEALALIKDHGGKLKAGYAMLGSYDLVLIVELPNMERAMKTAVGLSRMLGITFNTSPAVTFEDFDKLMMED